MVESEISFQCRRLYFPLVLFLSISLIQQFAGQYAIGIAMVYDLMLKPSDYRHGTFVCSKPALLWLLQLQRRMRDSCKLHVSVLL